MHTDTADRTKRPDYLKSRLQRGLQTHELENDIRAPIKGRFLDFLRNINLLEIERDGTYGLLSTGEARRNAVNGENAGIRMRKQGGKGDKCAEPDGSAADDHDGGGHKKVRGKARYSVESGEVLFVQKATGGSEFSLLEWGLKREYERERRETYTSLKR